MADEMNGVQQMNLEAQFKQQLLQTGLLTEITPPLQPEHYPKGRGCSFLLPASLFPNSSLRNAVSGEFFLRLPAHRKDVADRGSTWVCSLRQSLVLDRRSGGADAGIIQAGQESLWQPRDCFI